VSAYAALSERQPSRRAARIAVFDDATFSVLALAKKRLAGLPYRFNSVNQP
jgi:hypothetical protein